MMQDHEDYHRPKNKQPWWKTSFGMTVIFFFFVGGYFLAKEHSAHIGENWIWLILLACPLMHFFMHGSHGGHGSQKHSDDEEEK
ncbi:MAG: hypothetical protein DHS20C07_30190 [Methyloligella sp.]|jgi:quinol-cytochrome oxidoreductase complex cytochrome b subunit|nr:MAG: hypothetical protein DHS20C07_30190 [Methyloligella sp.]